MTPIGALILVTCFLGPIIPPIVGTVVGSIYDAAKRRAAAVDARPSQSERRGLVKRAA